MTRNGNVRAEGGFTLLELLVVLVILGLLAAVAAPQLMRYLGVAKSDAARIQIQNLETVLDLYKLETGRYPTSQEGLLALWERPAGVRAWSGPYVKRREMLSDPWGQIYQYRHPGRSREYEVFTLGSDQAVGGEGEARDVGNW
jgi:general secretion pathway protein G